MARSRIALLTQVRAVISGKAKLSGRESGWVKESYRQDANHTVCLNGALALTEKDLFNIRTTEGLDRYEVAERIALSRDAEAVKALLADTIQEMFPDRVDDRPLRSRPAAALRRHHVILDFNDHDDTTIEDVNAVLEKCEANAFERWQHPEGAPTDDTAFIDTIT